MQSSTIVRRGRVDDSHLSSISHPIVRQIFASRGISSDTELDKGAGSLLRYTSLQGIDAAVVVLADAIDNGQKIIVIGDFDADGATSTALSMLSLADFGSKNHSYLVPNRFNFGYGLSPEIVEVAHQQNADVIMTVDNGIACIDGANRAKELGIKVVITDHHLAAKTLPTADAIVNPNQPGCEFLSKNLAGVGVAFYVMLALRSYLREKGWFKQNQIPEPNLAAYLDIVALGTVADVVPLDNNNRILVYQGLQRIKSAKCRPGITALIDIAGKNANRMVATDLGFVLGPRLNAAGRLDDMALGIECLLATDPSMARRMAVQLDSLNQERKDIQNNMQDEAIASLDSLNLNKESLPDGIVLCEESFHQGVIGILAGRIKEQFNRPTIAFAYQDSTELKGSARSIQGLHIRDLLEDLNSQNPGLIKKFGGHAMAAGLTIDANKLDEFSALFAEKAKQELAGQNLDGEILSDGALSKNEFSIEFAQALKDAGPWGQGFPEPIFDDEFQLVEQRVLGGKHLKMIVKHPTGALIDAIAFNIDGDEWPNHQIQKVHLAYKLDINEFRGRISLQLLVDHVVPILSQ